MGSFEQGPLSFSDTLFHHIAMGTGKLDTLATKIARQNAKITTALLVLVMLEQHHPRHLTTFELGLWIADVKDPPRPLSIIMKTLAHDGYIERHANAGKRTAFWRLSKRGAVSLQKRASEAALAAQIIALQPNLSAQELTILDCLVVQSPQTASGLTSTSGLLLSPIRTALKRLSMRSFIETASSPAGGYALTSRGRVIAQRIIGEKCGRDDRCCSDFSGTRPEQV